MLEVKFYDLNTIEDNRLSFAVIMAQYKGKWVFVRHRERKTWEIPGGHREEGEDINFTASRELKEETGSEKFNLVPICVYSVKSGDEESFGGLFFAEIESFGELPDFEIGEVKLFDNMPEDLTYPLIQPLLFERALGYLSNRLYKK